MLELDVLLENASKEDIGAQKIFFETLLESVVVVPLQGSLAENLGEVPVLGKAEGDTSDFQFVEYEGRKTLPIFSEVAHIQTWAERELPYVRKEFKTLLWLMKGETWLYLNPSQPVGKELSPWEIELLREGKEAIAEIVDEISTSVPESLNIESGRELYPELKPKLNIIFEAYPKITEAFLLEVSDDETRKPVVMVGVRHEGLREKQFEALRKEFEEVGMNYLDERDSLLFVGDIDDRANPNALLFREIPPFYIAQQDMPKQTFFQKLLRRVSGSKESRDEGQTS